ncbi:FapA family protein [Vibrio sp. ZSDE26]|uniref:FapA family protein n=1 Tax=Vibrio amylolyticus TaxID=2847292 RepID=A0A9X1XLU0_9VIBR|nr:FapA family protein [Vibrio amylolyticus]MCK6264198.1 FapA family protein [Vibrio amylolyticus]
MWKNFISFSDDEQQVVARLTTDITVDNNFDIRGLEEALANIEAGHLCVIEENVLRFISRAKDQKKDAYDGIMIAEIRNAVATAELSEHDMLASITVTGAFGGRGLRGNEIVHCLSQAHITKGINKLALKKVLVVSNQLKAGEKFTQIVAKGVNQIQGKDAKFVPLVQDVSSQVLSPQARSEDDKVDMLDLGETITVDEGQPLMKRIPATKGKAGITVQGKVIPPKPGNDKALSAGKGSHISPTNPNLLLASFSGMPILKEKTVDVDNALCLSNIGVATGHIKFKGSIVVTGNIESDMMVRATGSITVGGFIESADVQAQGDIEVAKGIIGHTTSEGDSKTCVVKSGGLIRANYAQFSELQAADDIYLSVHCLNNTLRCGKDLHVSDSAGRQGTLSGGTSKVGGKITCINLGVEGDTATHVEGFAKFPMFKERISKLKARYKLAQEATMEIIRRELEFKKIPKSERTQEQESELEEFKLQANTKLENAKLAVDSCKEEFDALLATNTVEVKSKVYSHVTVQYGEEKVITKRSHGPSVFSFNQYKIDCVSMMGDEAVAEL